MRKLACTLLVFVFLCSVLFVGDVRASQTVNGIITSDTTWTKAGSPYVLETPVFVNPGVTLTIDPGVEVQGDNYLAVNGILRAVGTSTEPILFNCTDIRFTPSSTSWDESSGSGSVIENTVGLYRLNIDDCSPKINNNIIDGQTSFFGGSVYNGGAICILSGSPIITNNAIVNGENGVGAYDGNGIFVNSGSPIIRNNNITGIYVMAGSPVISDNYLTRGNPLGSLGIITVAGGLPSITNNKIVGTYHYSENYNSYAEGIQIHNNQDGLTISGNIIVGCSDGIHGDWGSNKVIIEKNLIFNNTVNGIEIGGNSVISKNTFANNPTAIKLLYTISSTINNNNFQDNRKSIYLEGTQAGIDATNNWWGTTDSAAISQTIYDSRSNPNLGAVNFTPFLNSPDTEAPAITDDVYSLLSNAATMPTQTTEPQNPSATPYQPTGPTDNPAQGPQQAGVDSSFFTNSLMIMILVVLVIVVVFVGILIVLVVRKHH